MIIAETGLESGASPYESDELACYSILQSMWPDRVELSYLVPQTSVLLLDYGHHYVVVKTKVGFEPTENRVATCCVRPLRYFAFIVTVGVEPTRYRKHRILSPERLPIPPRHFYINNRGLCGCQWLVFGTYSLCNGLRVTQGFPWSPRHSWRTNRTELIKSTNLADSRL